ncbi:MAG TPA: single-stranded-DNA-specific exonuclease RecJ [Brevundimonas sp.]|jgi:single-stranded-DNA-specific exonuclease|uniref:single-stranded-DNA-specific exonuclease RecJ n=1 Tax=Brevundimonas sp. TaxID=1871086 RepID=UPI002DEFC146|nr:single-stranded-DNA-specific exonuclease RecJ [Brevundimonas sp.]
MADGAPQAALGAFLGVERSLSGRTWRQRAADADVVRGLMQERGLNAALAGALAARGQDAAGVADFLDPTLRAWFPDPSCFLDMDVAAEAIVDAVASGASVHVFADYDVDGASSAALLVRWFRAMGAELPIYVPDRLTEGYGPSARAFDALKATGADLVVTVDCGAAAVAALEHAAAIGLRVVVVDHHLMRDTPPAVAVVNPNRPGCGSGQGNLAAAGVVFVLLAALNREARRRGMFANRPEPDLRQWLDLAALGAICDVTSLTGFNRALAALGLRVMSGWGNPGLRALLAAAGSEPGPAGSNHAGFILGPRINAGGRIGRADLGARLLSTDDPVEAQDLAAQLHALNLERREVERQVTEAAIRRVEATGAHADDSAVVVVAEDDWHPGVIGIVAGRLRERWRKPVIVIGVDAVNGVGKGSGRSQPGMDLGRAVQAAWDAGILLAGGGHPMAAGLTVAVDRVNDLSAFLNERLRGDRIQAAELDALEIDALIEPRSADRALFDAFQQMTPHGPGNPEPVFALEGVAARDAAPMGQGHVRCRLVGPDGASVRAVAWRCADLPHGRALLAGQGGLTVAGRLKADDWNGRRGVQFEIEDVADLRAV